MGRSDKKKNLEERKMGSSKEFNAKEGRRKCRTVCLVNKCVN